MADVILDSTTPAVSENDLRAHVTELGQRLARIVAMREPVVFGQERNPFTERVIAIAEGRE